MASIPILCALLIDCMAAPFKSAVPQPVLVSLASPDTQKMAMPHSSLGKHISDSHFQLTHTQMHLAAPDLRLPCSVKLEEAMDVANVMWSSPC